MGQWRDTVPPIAKQLTLRFRAAEGLFQLEAESVYLSPEAARAALSVSGASGALTYLVNALASAGGATPYSFVLARDGLDLREDEMAINRWLADALGAKAGDAVEMTYFELLPSSRFEARTRRMVVRHLLDEDAMRLERTLAPHFPGLSDVDRCADWDVGFPMEEEQLADAANEAYWNAYGPTPKAVVSSCMPPLSVRTTAASFHRFRNAM